MRLGNKCSPVSAGFAANVLGPWSIDGIPGGNSTLGTIRGPERVDYTAPEKVPSPDTVIASAQVTAYDGKRAAPLKMKIRIVPAGLAYSGRYEFTQLYGGDLTITGTVDFVWTQKSGQDDVIEYTATNGQANARFEAANCDPAEAPLALVDSTLTVYTAANTAFPRQYHFSASTEATVSLQCGTPRMTVPRVIGLVVTGGLLCNSPPPFAPYTDETLLRGNERCTNTSSSWSFSVIE
ncbi:MAG: hypothetical protein Q8N23_04730 [Archangium sp.]|nr:hypothetical protein [Archangium sp.]MDP3151949.1 hypothetical protein [Archangium sp.]MDP3571362.1 hypothetical protein [Archangium sp.]